MRICLLGTGGAEGVPAIYGDTRVSDFARTHGGKDLRTRSAAIIDGTLKIDFGPDTLAQIHRERLDARDWLALIVTHSHDDHLCLTQLQYLVFPFNELDRFPFPIYGNDGVRGKLADEYPDWPIELHPLTRFESTTIGPYRVTPVEAYHMQEEEAHNFLIEKDGRTLFYATDTGIWREQSWEFLKGVSVDTMVIESTEGLNPTDYYGHLSLAETIDVVARLRAQGTLKPGSRVITTHHSHRGDLTHAELEERLRPHEIEPGFDGMTFDV